MRRKVHINITLSHYVVSLLDEVEKLSGWNRSRCIEEALRVGLPDLMKRLKSTLLKSPPGSGGEGAEDLSEEYMRALLTGKIKGDEWTPV